MPNAEQKAIVRRVLDEIVSQGRLDLANELIVETYLHHGAILGLPPGREGFCQVVTLLRTAFPDLRVTIEDLIAEEDMVVVRVVTSGTHQGAVGGIPPTGKRVMFSAIQIYRIDAGQVVERWGEGDIFGLLQQLDALPAFEQIVR
jgi:steroid delta-isomerase-like uncharacterized protein